MKLKELHEAHKLITDANKAYNWCAKMGMEGFLVTSQGLIDSNKSVALQRKALTRIPVQFRKVKGSFSVSENKLRSLLGSPIECSGFFATLNNLKSLEFSPKIVTGSFFAADNALTSFEGITPVINGIVNLSGNKIISLENIADHIKKINGKLILDFHLIKTGGIGILLVEGVTEISGGLHALPEQFRIIRNYLGRPNDIYECQAELIDAGFEEFAQL